VLRSYRAVFPFLCRSSVRVLPLNGNCWGGRKRRKGLHFSWAIPNPHGLASMDGCRSGRTGSPGKRVYLIRVPRVRIPPHPPCKRCHSRVHSPATASCAGPRLFNSRGCFSVSRTGCWGGDLNYVDAAENGDPDSPLTGESGAESCFSSLGIRKRQEPIIKSKLLTGPTRRTRRSFSPPLGHGLCCCRSETLLIPI
jgi:hypothetical protein